MAAQPTLHFAERRADRPVAAIALAILLPLSLLSGCKTSAKYTPSIPPPPQGIPPYRTIAERYNRHLEGLDQLWSRVSLDAVTYDHKAKKQSMSTDDALIMTIPPNKMLLRIGKAGQDLMWAGFNEQVYWLFDVYEHDTAYVGRHVNFGRPGTRRLNLPAHLQPMDLPRMLGLVKVDPNRLPPFDFDNPRVRWDRKLGTFVIQPPDTGMRLYIAPRTYLPRKIELLDRRGKPFMTAELSKPGRVDLDEQPADARPTIQTRIEITHASQPDTISLKLWNMNDGRRRRGIKKAQFNFDALVELFQPVKIEDLDKPAGQIPPDR